HASSLVQNHPNLSLGFSPSRPYWRVRRASNKSGFSKLSELMAPPAQQTAEGRLNHRGSPQLYLSLALDTALAELGATQGELYHAIGLLCTGKKLVRVTVVGEHHHVLRTGYLKHS